MHAGSCSIWAEKSFSKKSVLRKSKLVRLLSVRMSCTHSLFILHLSSVQNAAVMLLRHLWSQYSHAHRSNSTISFVFISVLWVEMTKPRQNPLSSHNCSNALLHVTHPTRWMLLVANTLPDHPISYCRSSGIKSIFVVKQSMARHHKKIWIPTL